MTDPVPAAREMNELQRLTGVFWEPRPVFENLAAHPRWWTPLLVLTVLAVIFTTMLSRVVGFETIIRQQMESNTRLQQLPPEQIEKIIAQQTGIASKIGIAGACVGVSVATLAIAGILFGVFSLAGGATLKFKQAFSATCYSFLPTGLSTILALIVMYFKDPADFDVRSPLPLSAGAFLDASSVPKWLHSVATSIDVFSIWVMLLLAVGFSAALGKMRFPRALTLVLSTWVVWVLVKAGWAAIFG